MFKASVLFFFFKASVLYYDQLPVKNCLEVLNQKRKRKSPGGNSFSWMILWSWKHSPEAAFSLPRINLASVLQLPARDGASQNQHGVFQLISVPLHLHLAPPCPLLLPVTAQRGRSLPGLWPLLWTCLPLGSPGAKVSEKQRIKYLRSLTGWS